MLSGGIFEMAHIQNVSSINRDIITYSAGRFKSNVHRKHLTDEYSRGEVLPRLQFDHSQSRLSIAKTFTLWISIRAATILRISPIFESAGYKSIQ